ncbi:MAG: GAF domain-containing protein [Cyanobacteria bacterium P01_G01_bin.38]
MLPQPIRSIKTPEELLHRMTDRIRQSIELPEILSTTVDEMRRFLGTDRVKVYRFDDDGSGEVIAEAIREQRLPSLIGHRFPADDIPEHAREMFLSARQRTIVDVAKQEIGISPLLCHTTQKPIATNLWVRPVDPCHVEYLTAMGVRSSLVIPILYRHQLWGLLVAHHSVPRRVSRKELEVVQLIADQVAVAISHASLLHLTRLQGQHEAIVNQVVSLLHSTPQDALQKALDQTMMALQCIGGRLYIPGKNPESNYQLVSSGIQPELNRRQTLQQPVLEQLPDWQTWLDAEAPNQLVDQLWDIPDIKQTPLSWTIASALLIKNIRGVLVARLAHRNRFLGYLSLFRQSTDFETVWAGQLDASDPRQHRPRQSFETWRELKRDQAHPWAAREIGLVQDLADRFASVIYQTQLYQEVQALNADLEARVMQRTMELQQLNESLRQEIIERERTLQELQQARDSLKRLSHQNELILNSAGEGIYGIDPGGKAVFINPAAAKALGYPKEKLIGQFMHDLLSHATPEKQPHHWEQSPIFKTLKQGQTHHVSGDLFERQDGSSFPIEYVSTPIYENGTIVGAVVIFKDITERQVIESMKDEFIAVVSHELRTPLTSIRAALGLLAEDTLEIPASKRQRMVTIAFSNTKRLVRLVNDILDVERIKLGKITLNKKKCNLANIMSQAADEMRAMAENRDIHLNVFPISAQLWAAPDRLIQTLTNLLSNAIKFSPVGTTVEMRAQQIDSNNVASITRDLNPQGKEAIQLGLGLSEALLLIQVKDQGQGIPDNKIETIFGRFEQLDASDIGHQGGTGLGLAICRSIVQQHSGKIWAQSAVGLGSTFYFTLPSLTDPSLLKDNLH